MIENLGQVSKYDARFFHLYADGKRIREVDIEELRANKFGLKNKKSMLLSVHSNYIHISKGPNYVWVPLSQIIEILESLK